MGMIKGAVLLVVLVFILGCVQQTQQNMGSEMMDEELEEEMEERMEEVMGEELAEEMEEVMEEHMGELPVGVKGFTITAKRWEFSPETITVNEGDTVKLTITSIDVTHGFSLSDFNINEKLEPNQPVTVEFVADKIGTFQFKCNIPCGSGHSSMNGEIIVE